MEKQVLVTGGTGRIGRHLIAELLKKGYRVRALTSRLPLPRADPGIEWRHQDWQQSIDFESHTDACDAVLHLAAAIWDIPKMRRANVEATEALARAAESCGIRFFGYTSSIAVYGSPFSPVVTEESPTLTEERDITSEYLANDSLRAYGRTKLAGENKLREAAVRTEYAVVRPTVVVDIPELVALGKWSAFRHAVSGLRHTHHIYVKDVVAALIWLMERALSRPSALPGVSVYNLSDDLAGVATYRQFFQFVFTRTGAEEFKSRFPLPLCFYGLLNQLKHRTFTRRRSLGQMLYSPEKLYAEGYRHPFGIVRAYELAASEVREKGRSS